MKQVGKQSKGEWMESEWRNGNQALYATKNIIFSMQGYSN